MPNRQQCGSSDANYGARNFRDWTTYICSWKVFFLFVLSLSCQRFYDHSAYCTFYVRSPDLQGSSLKWQPLLSSHKHPHPMIELYPLEKCSISTSPTASEWHAVPWVCNEIGLTARSIAVDRLRLSAGWMLQIHKWNNVLELSSGSTQTHASGGAVAYLQPTLGTSCALMLLQTPKFSITNSILLLLKKKRNARRAWGSPISISPSHPERFSPCLCLALFLFTRVGFCVSKLQQPSFYHSVAHDAWLTVSSYIGVASLSPSLSLSLPFRLFHIFIRHSRVASLSLSTSVFALALTLLLATLSILSITSSIPTCLGFSVFACLPYSLSLSLSLTSLSLSLSCLSLSLMSLSLSLSLSHPFVQKQPEETMNSDSGGAHKHESNFCSCRGMGQEWNFIPLEQKSLHT